MMRYLFLVFFISFSTGLYATHGTGSTLSVSYTGTGDVYVVKYTFYRDCGGITPSLTQEVYYLLNGNMAGQLTLQWVNFIPWASTLCYTGPVNCTNGQGVEEYIYQDTISLPVTGLYNFFTYEDGTGANYTAAVITVAPGMNDHTPEFTSHPEFDFCLNVPITLVTDATDADGDSIVYSLIPARVLNSMGNGGVPITYTPPLSATNFIYSSTPIVFNTQAGIVSFTPNVQQVGVMVVAAMEYRNGSWIGASMREIEFTSTTNGISINAEELIPADISVYPNPATDRLYIDTSDEINNYSITDLAGHIIMKGIYDQSIDLAQVRNGMYMVHVNTSSGNRILKIIKE